MNNTTRASSLLPEYARRTGVTARLLDRDYVQLGSYGAMGWDACVIAFLHAQHNHELGWGWTFVACRGWGNVVIPLCLGSDCEREAEEALGVNGGLDRQDVRCCV
jgi:hypothetical protein